MAFRDRRVTLKSASQIERMAVAGRLVADVLDTRRGGDPPGRHHARAGPHRRGASSAARAASRRSSACPATSRPTGTRCASASTARSSTASPASDASRRARSCPSTRAPSSMAGTVTRRARWIVGEVPDATPRSWSTRPAGRCSRASRRPSPGDFLGDISAAIEDVALEHGYGVVRVVRGPWHRHRDARGAAGHQLPHRQPGPAHRGRACAWPSSRCSRWAATRSG